MAKEIKKLKQIIIELTRNQGLEDTDHIISAKADADDVVDRLMGPYMFKIQYSTPNSP
jgi:hypothetical protein